MRDYSALSLKQACLSALVRQESQDLSPAALPRTLGRELEAARRLLGTYRITGLRIKTITRGGVDVTEAEKENMMAMIQTRYTIGMTYSLDVSQSTSDCSDDCPNKFFSSSYFESEKLIWETHHMHKKMLPDGEEREWKWARRELYSLDPAGGVLRELRGEMVSGTFSAVMQCETVEKKLQYRFGFLE
jgi:hypothetical protein